MHIIEKDISMQLKRILVVILLFSLFLSGTVLAQDTKVKKEKAKKSVVAEKKSKDAKKQVISNKTCPVMGEDVDASVQTVEYKGKVYGFCCKKCVKKFQDNPEKYLKK